MEISLYLFGMILWIIGVSVLVSDETDRHRYLYTSLMWPLVLAFYLLVLFPIEVSKFIRQVLFSEERLRQDEKLSEINRILYDRGIRDYLKLEHIKITLEQ